MVPLAGGILSAGATEAAGAATDQPQITARDRIRQIYFPNVTLRTQDNKKVRFYDDLIKDKIVTINFFYAKCEGVCPLITSNLVKVQKLLGKRMGRDIFMNSITLKAEEDTPAMLKDYEAMHRIGPGWNLLTGEAKDVELLRRSLGFINPDPRVDKDSTQHIGNVRYGNEPLMLWAACPGMAHAEWIAESISWVIRS
jgi:protein SCO1